jgi:hypothetical protein
MILAWADALTEIVVKSPKECTGVLTTMTPVPQAPTLAFTTVAKSLGLSSQNFRTTVRRHPEFIEAIAGVGIVEWGKGRYFTAFARADVEASAA